MEEIELHNSSEDDEPAVEVSSSNPPSITTPLHSIIISVDITMSTILFTGATGKPFVLHSDQ